MDDLQDRVEKFRAMELPGQPMGMHMGTLYLVGDLWREVLRLRELHAQSPQVPEVANANTPAIRGGE